MGKDRNVDPADKAADADHDPLTGPIDPANLQLIELSEVQAKAPVSDRTKDTKLATHVDPNVSAEDLSLFIEEQKKNPWAD